MPEYTQQDLEAVLARYGGLQEINKRFRKPVGKPPDKTKLCMDALVPVLQRYTAIRYKHPERQYKALTQGRLWKVVKSRLRRKGLTVGKGGAITETTMRDNCRLIVLLYGDKNFGNYSIEDWKFLILKAKREQRKELKRRARQMLEITRRAIKSADDNKAIMARQTKTPLIPEYFKSSKHPEIVEGLERAIKHWQAVVGLFPSP